MIAGAGMDSRGWKFQANEFSKTHHRVKSLVVAASTSNGDSIQSGFIETVNRWVKNKDRFPQPLYALPQQVDAAFNFDSRGRLEKIKAPTLVIVGDEDKNTVALSEQLKKQIPNSQLCIIGGSHGFNIENPALFNRAIIDFLC